MSQDDQRNQPNDEAEQAARRAEGSAGEAVAGTDGEAVAAPEGVAGVAGTTAAAAGTTAEPAQPGGSTMMTDEVPAGTATAAADETAAGTSARPVRREFHEPGEGAPRYALPPQEMPTSGSEESWSAEPHPGYKRDSARRYTTKRLVTSTVIGLVVLGVGSFFGYALLTAKSSNGNGPASWTGAVRQDGAVVDGINAQNNGVASPVDLPAGVTYGNSGTNQGAAINQAITACQTAATTSVAVTTATGTSAEISAWGNKAGPTVDDLHVGAATLQRTLIGTNAVTVANAAYDLCLGYPAVATVPPMPDAAGSQAWAAAVKAYADAASQALQGISGKPAMLTAANDSINTGNAQLAALSARVNSAT